MAKKQSARRLSEGHVKKGGVNQRPDRPKPNLKPVGQKPVRPSDTSK